MRVGRSARVVGELSVIIKLPPTLVRLARPSRLVRAPLILKVKPLPTLVRLARPSRLVRSLL